MNNPVHHKIVTDGLLQHYISIGTGPVVLCMHGWPQNHREFLPVIEGLSDRYRFIAPDLRGYADSGKPYDGYEPKTIAQDMLALLAAERVEKFHILSHDLGGPPSVALAYMASDRALSLATVETPFFGLNYAGYVDPRVPYWHLSMHMNMDITRFLVEGREEQYLRHFFRDFAYNPAAVPEEEVIRYATQMRQPGNLRASLNHYGYIPQMAEQTSELAKNKLTVPMLAWAGRVSFGDHCFNSGRRLPSPPRAVSSKNAATGSSRKKPNSSEPNSTNFGKHPQNDNAHAIHCFKGFCSTHSPGCIGLASGRRRWKLEGLPKSPRATASNTFPMHSSARNMALKRATP